MSKQQQQDNLDKLTTTLIPCGVNDAGWFKFCNQRDGACDVSMKVLVLLLISKLGQVPELNIDSYKRIIAAIIGEFCGEDGVLLIECSNLWNMPVEELIENQILEGARYIDRKRFIACLDELRSLGHIDDREGRLDTTAFAQFVNAYFFINQENHTRFIKNLYPDDKTSYPRYLASLKM
jgi:hypothetical protein